MSRSKRNILCGISLPIRAALGVLFIAASAYKITEPYEFGLSIATYEIMPLELINLMAIVLPWMELIIGCTLIAGFWTRASALAVSGMMIMFMLAIWISLSRELPISCGCFASAEASEDISSGTLVRDALWLAGAVYVLIIDDGRFGVDGLLARRKAVAR